MWFGTQDGLVRYDGYNMRVYQHDPDDSLSIGGLHLNSIFEDRSGTLWIGTNLGGLNSFDRATETFTRYVHNPHDSKSINSNNVGCISEDDSGDLLVGSNMGVDLFDIKTKNFKHIIYRAKIYAPAVYEYISSLIANGNRISSILRVGNNANLTKTFTIDKRTAVLTVMMGEAGYDYGWLESDDGKIIENKNYNNTVCAADYTDNAIQIVIDTLYKGSYRLRYISDENYSYNEWNGQRPAHPEFWGIQVIKIPEDQESVKEILSNIKTSILNYDENNIIRDRSTGNIYVGSNGRFFIFDRATYSLEDDNRISRLNSNIGRIISFLQTNDSTIWIAHSRGMAKFNPLVNTIKCYQPLPSIQFKLENKFYHLVEDENGFIWSSREFPNNQFNLGLICFDPVKEQFKIYQSDLNKEGSLSTNTVWSIYKDHSGILWIGTFGGGLNKWDRNKHRFKRFSFDSNGKPFNSVYTFTEDKEGIIWLGTDNGLYSFNRQSNEFRQYMYYTESENNVVRYIYIDETGIIWLGTGTRGLGRFDREKSSIHFYSNNHFDSASISNNEIRYILPDGSDALWIGTRGGGLNKFDKKTGKFTRFEHEPSNPKSLSGNQIECVYKDRNANLWIGTIDGEAKLNLFDHAENSFKPYNLVVGWWDPSIMTIYEDHKTNFWLGTFLNGLYLFDRDKGKPVYSITVKDGLSNNTPRSISEDDSGNLWIGTSNGLSKFNPETHDIKNYFIPSGFGANSYIVNSACKTSDGEMLFGTDNGFIMFQPDSIKDDPVPPQVVITNVSLFNRPGKKLKIDGFISELKELDLSYDENDLRFDYVGLHYGVPSKNEYKYKLEGFDKDWVNAGTQRNATYTNLDAGEYTFWVTASNSDGTWNKEGASIKIVIPPPFWATWLAYGFYFLSFGMIMYGIRKYEMNRLKWKNQFKLDEVKLKEREETDRMKSRFFANISHEFRTPLTLILGPAEKIHKDLSGEEIEKQTDMIKRNANHLLALINQLLDLSKLEAGKLELKASMDNIVSFIKGITMSFESAAERKDITLKVKSSSEEIQFYFDKEKMTKIMTNLLSNAFKFTHDGGQITVSINDTDDNKVRIKVRDTGIGISEEELPKLFDRFYQVDSSQTREHEGTGIGLALTKELVELHHGSISVHSQPGQWTEFTIELPHGREHLKDKEIIEEISEDEVIPNGVKNQIEFDNVNSSSSGINQTPENDIEDKNIILVVEDNADVRDFIKNSLDSGFRIEEASNGEQGVRKAEQIIPDLIISDIMMPKMDGNELTRTLKNDEKTSHIPIILLTAKSEQQSKLEGLETGADDYLIKPFDTKELQIRIKNLISIRQKLQEKYSRGDYIPDKRTEEKKLSNLEEQFLSKVTEVMERHLSEEEFSIEEFGKEAGMSRVQLHRKLKALTGKSASNYLRTFRLSRAKVMIEEQKGNISEIAYSVGFSSPAYFTRCFKEEFGYPPSDLQI